MADDGSGEKREAIKGQVLPRGDTPADELAELKQQTAVIEAIGDQVKAIVETPGIAAYLRGLGETMAANAKLAADAQQNKHQLSMEQEKNGAASRRRLELIGAVLLPLLGAMGLGSIFGLAWMVHAEIVTQSNAVTMGIVLAGLLSWVNGQRKKPDDKRSGSINS